MGESPARTDRSTGTRHHDERPPHIVGRYRPHALRPALDRVARDHRLGYERARADRTWWGVRRQERPGRARIGSIILWVAGVTAGVLGGLLILVARLLRDGAAPPALWLIGWAGVVLGGITTTWIALATRAATELRPASLYCFDDGLVGAHPDAHLYVWRWSAVTALYSWGVDHRAFFIRLSTRHTLRLCLDDGYEVDITGWVARWGGHHDQAVLALRQAVIDEVGRRLLPATIQRLRGGEEVAFGPLLAGQSGLQTPDGTVPWPVLHHSLRVRRGQVYFSMPLDGTPTLRWKRRWKAPISTIPNLTVLTAIPAALGQASHPAG